MIYTLQDRTECYCDNIIGGGLYPSDRCTTSAYTCPGNSNLRCGTGMRNDVFLAAGTQTGLFT